jgi:hypothetical protein
MLITLTYSPPVVGQPQGAVGGASLNRVVANPAIAKVAPGEDIQFRLSPDSPQGDLVVTFHEPGFFSAPEFRATLSLPAGPPVRLTGDLRKITFYKCELFVNGKLQATGDGADGGGIEPSHS